MEASNTTGTLLKWMIWGYHYFRKHPYDSDGWQDDFGFYKRTTCTLYTVCGHFFCKWRVIKDMICACFVFSYHIIFGEDDSHFELRILLSKDKDNNYSTSNKAIILAMSAMVDSCMSTHEVEVQFQLSI